MNPRENAKQNLIEARNLAHSFDNLLFEGINLSVAEGESIAILGVSGSGKSTLLSILATLLSPLQGKVDLAGIADIYAKSDSEILRIRRNIVGIIFQAHYLFRGFNALENLQTAAIIANTKLDMELLESFGIADTLKQHIGELSGGQQQRLSIARVLTKKPRIIFADEPTGNLDSQTTRVVMERIFGYVRAHNAAIIIVTHDSEIAQMCDRRYYLKERHLVES